VVHALFHPEDAPSVALTEWTFEAPMTGMPESARPSWASSTAW
jgi:hypothetical protein